MNKRYSKVKAFFFTIITLIVLTLGIVVWSLNIWLVSQIILSLIALYATWITGIFAYRNIKDVISSGPTETL